MVNKLESTLINNYQMAKSKLDTLQNSVDEYFMPALQKALREKDVREARRLFIACPDTVVLAFMMDAIRQTDLWNEILPLK